MNRIESYVAYGNGASDLSDENPSFGSTLWGDNDSETRDQPCIG